MDSLYFCLRKNKSKNLFTLKKNVDMVGMWRLRLMGGGVGGSGETLQSGGVQYAI